MRQAKAGSKPGPGLVALVCALLCGCASEAQEVENAVSTDVHRDCVLHGDRRPLGARFKYFFGMVAQADDVIAEDFRRGSENLSHDADRFWAIRGEEVRATGALITGIPSSIADSWSMRTGYLADDTGRWADRIVEDSRCFFPRAWRSLKLLE